MIMKSVQKPTQKSKTVVFKKLVFLFASALLVVSCKPNANEAGVIEDNKQATIDSMNTVMEKQKIELAKQKSIDSMQAIVSQQRNAKQNVVYHNTTTTEKRKGWSGAAKGAVIGAGVGAISGAVIDKKKPAQGAVIGGLAGAGLGAGAGAILDSQKKK